MSGGRLLQEGSGREEHEHDSGGILCLSREIEVNSLVLFRLFPSRYVELSRLTSIALPFGPSKAGDCISPREKSVKDLLA
jgi:hypothetical protein